MYVGNANEDFSENAAAAYNEGYAAGIEYHMEGDLSMDDNPFCRTTEEALWDAWNDGFTQAGEDS